MVLTKPSALGGGLAATPLGAIFMNTKKIILLFGIFLIVGIISFPILYNPDNLGVSLKGVYVKKGSEKMKLSSIINQEYQKFVVFFSYDCSACKELSDNKFIADKLIFVNVDYNKKIPTDVFQLIPSKKLEVFYIPYIVRIDSNYTIIEEYKLYEIQDLIKNKELL